MASGIWETASAPTSARAVLTRTVSSRSRARPPISAGYLHVVTQVGADALGSARGAREVRAGRLEFPKAPSHGGSANGEHRQRGVLAAARQVAAAAPTPCGLDHVSSRRAARMRRCSGPAASITSRRARRSPARPPREASSYAFGRRVHRRADVDADLGLPSACRASSAPTTSGNPKLPPILFPNPYIYNLISYILFLIFSFLLSIFKVCNFFLCVQIIIFLIIL